MTIRNALDNEKNPADDNLCYNVENMANEINFILGGNLASPKLNYLKNGDNVNESIAVFNFLQIDSSPQALGFVRQAIDTGVNGALVTVSPFFKYPPNSNYATLYPKLTEYLKNQLPKVKDIPLIVNTIKDITGLTEEQIKNDLQWGQGPTIEITQLDNYADNTDFKTVAAFDDDTPNIIYLDIDYVNDLENNITDQGIEDSYLFFFGVTILHEYVHLGDLTDGVDYPGEEGDIFELRVYGLDVDFDTALFVLNKN